MDTPPITAAHGLLEVGPSETLPLIGGRSYKSLMVQAATPPRSRHLSIKSNFHPRTFSSSRLISTAVAIPLPHQVRKCAVQQPLRREPGVIVRITETGTIRAFQIFHPTLS